MRVLSRKLRNSLVAWTLAAGVAATGAVVVTAAASAASASMVATTDVNLRSGPGTSYGILAVVPEGAAVTATGSTTGYWVAVAYGGTSGYVAGAYLAPSAATGTGEDAPAAPSASGNATTTADVNVRTGPGTSYGIVAVATQGTAVETTGTTSGTWSQVRWSGATRWISSAYLTSPIPDAAPPAPSSPGASSPAPADPAPAPAAPASAAGQVRATTDLNLRTAGYLGAPIWGVLPANSIVDVTGEATATYTQVLYRGSALWVSSKYLVVVTAAPAASAPAPGSVAAQVVAFAKDHLGAPYSVGSMGPVYYDCSGLVAAAYQSAGVAVPHSMSWQSTNGTPVALADLQPGDVVSWGSPVSAVSIYVGDGTLILADGPGYGVRSVSLASRLSWSTFAGAHRFG